MPFALIFVGLLLATAGARNQSSQLVTLVKGDIEAGYISWMVAILAIGALGYIAPLQKLSRWFLALVILVLLVSNQGFFAQLQAGLKPQPTSN